MALSPFKTPQSPLNRSRSSSCSSPLRNRIVYQEVYSIGHNTLVRSYSCDQVFDKDETGRTYQTTQIQVSSFITPDKKVPPSDKMVQKNGRRLILEPAKQENQKPDEKELNTELPESCTVPHSSVKRKIMFVLLTVTSACVLYLYMSFRECSYVWDLERTELELKENIFGQDKAVDKINSVLKICNNTIGSHIMVFTGGVGVGKTYSSSIIARNFPWSSNKLITYSEYFSNDVEKLVIGKLSTCGCNLVIVDDLSVESVEEAIDLTYSLRTRRKHNENLLIILIFQTHTDNEKTDIIKEIKRTFSDVYYISFQTLTRDDVEKCFQFEIKRQGVMISNSDLRHLVEEKMKYVEVVKGPAGCKGVSVDIASYTERKVQ